MKKHRIATVIHFCTNEAQFLRHAFEQALLFSTEVIAVSCSHFFDGTKENRSLLDQIYASFPKILFIEYPYRPSLIPKKLFQILKPVTFWRCFSRLVGFSMLSDQVDWVLFLDADEIVDGNRFSEWLNFSGYQYYTALKMANYWYFQNPTCQAKTWKDSITFLPKKSILPEMLLDSQERDALYNELPAPKRRMVIGSDGKPMFHHFNRLQEVKKGSDFIHRDQFQEIDPPFLFDAQFSEVQNPKKNVLHLTEKELLRLVKLRKVPFSWKDFLQELSSLLGSIVRK